MRCHLLLPALFPPPALTRENDPLHGATAPSLQKLLSRGNRVMAPATGMEAWLCASFGIEAHQNVPVGLFSAMGDDIDVENGYWLRADPVHLNLERDQLILAESSTFALSRQEADDLVAALNRHFAPDGLHFIAPLPQRWYLRLDHPPSLTTHGLYQAAGRNIHPLLPAGKDAMHWRALLNEVQMLLFQHPVNAMRQAAGEAPVNSIWPWGAGSAPKVKPRAPFDSVWASDPLALGLAQAAGVPGNRLPEDARTCLDRPRGKNFLIVLDALQPVSCYGDARGWREALMQLERNWFVPIRQAVQDGRLALSLHAPDTAGTITCTAGRSDLWKLWRPSRPLIHFRSPYR